jgi:hypothetical protein
MTAMTTYDENEETLLLFQGSTTSKYDSASRFSLPAYVTRTIADVFPGLIR